MSLYSQFLSRNCKSVDSIRNYISGVKLLHLFLDKEYPEFDSFRLKLVLRGLSRTKPYCPRQAQPTTPKLLCDMFRISNHKNSYDATFWCLFVHPCFLMFRKSNLVPDSVRSFNGVKAIMQKKKPTSHNIKKCIIWSTYTLKKNLLNIAKEFIDIDNHEFDGKKWEGRGIVI